MRTVIPKNLIRWLESVAYAYSNSLLSHIKMDHAKYLLVQIELNELLLRDP
jgi:hypothetical protein